VPVSLLLAPVSKAGVLTSVGAGALSLALALVSIPGALRTPTMQGARRTFLASIAYMFLLLVLLFADAVLIGRANA
jgi:heme O synthase-like polyprenyltransferase